MPWVKRVLLNPRAYIVPFLLCIVLHHIPIVVAYALLWAPDGSDCQRLDDLEEWLLVSFILHLIIAFFMLVNITITELMPVRREFRPENYVVTFIAQLYLVNLGWVIYGEASFPVNTSSCAFRQTDEELSSEVQSTASRIGSVQHFDFVFTPIIIGLAIISSFCFGVHSTHTRDFAARRWAQRCLCCYRCFTCRDPKELQQLEDDIFGSLGNLLGRFFVVHNQTTNEYEGLEFNDLSLALRLVSRAQREERESMVKKLENQVEGDDSRQAAPSSTSTSMAPFLRDIRSRESSIFGSEKLQQRFPRKDERHRLKELSRYGRLAIAIYGWPIYVWYSPCFWFRLLSCCAKTMEDQIVEKDTLTQSNRASFLSYSGVPNDALIYLNCTNNIFTAPFAIVKDVERKELVISIRGSMSMYDFMTDGMAEVVRMDPSELPGDIPNPMETRTHKGMLRTARLIWQNLGEKGKCKERFWDFAMQNCRVDTTLDEEVIGDAKHDKSPREWSIVVTGHSMGAGVGGILSIFLKKYFPDTRAFLYASPMLFDPFTAKWTRSFMTTTVYGDDIVPRLSIANMTRLRDELIDRYRAVADEPYYKSNGWYKVKRKTDQRLRGTPAPSPRPFEPNAGFSALEEENRANELRITIDRELDEANPMTTPKAEKLTSHVWEPIEKAQEVDVPGDIVHIHTAQDPRNCSCTMLLGEQDLTYTRRDAKFFRRIWVNARSAQDHMVHHYDRNIVHLIDRCLVFDDDTGPNLQDGSSGEVVDTSDSHDEALSSSSS